MKYGTEMPAPGDIKKLDHEERIELCSLCREIILETVSKNGGHLASNLGVVELTVALHYVFDFPKDKLIFDVGHQSYVHKLLSGRVDKFGTLRTTNGISGFQNRNESEYDCFGGGHSGTAIAAALGFATAAKLRNEESYAIAVIGDGAFSNGMVHEAIINASEKKLNLIIIVNDNDKSISDTITGVSKCFGKLRKSTGYHRFKGGFKRKTSKMKLIGRPIAAIGKFLKNMVKHIVWKPNFFECYEIDYMGIVEGHNLKKLISILEAAKQNDGVTVVHVETKKGKGYKPAEDSPEKYHSVGPFNRDTGITDDAEAQSFDKVFGDGLVGRANQNKDIVAITAAMCDGTGLEPFKAKYPDKFFDVGIAEEHAVTFAAGLAAARMKPFFAVYSSFLQRGYDQIIHDVAIQNLPVTFAISHAGLVPGDGATHQGIFDCGFLISIPNITVYSAECFDDIGGMLNLALDSNGPVAIRYPKGGEGEYNRSSFRVVEGGGYKICRFGEEGQARKRVCLMTHGRLTKQIYEAAVKLSDKYSVRVISITRVKPLNVTGLMEACNEADYVYFVEEQIRTGCVGEVLFSEMRQFGCALPPFEINAINDQFPEHGSLEDLFDYYGFSAKKIEEHIRAVVD